MMKTTTFIPFFITIMMILMLMFMANNIYSHPIMNMILIIIYSILMTLNMSIWKMNFMYSIMLFLIMISGLLIIFLYFSSLISNEQMTFILNNNKLFLLTIMLNIMFLIFNIINKKIYYFNPMYQTSETNLLNKINEKMFNNILNLYTYPYNNLTIMCMMFLLISLFTIIKISSMKSKSLRKMSK
ncbi:NADH dehydrogenase subunit 6 (mitochondrion) [Linepithema humile]|uniref:NADH dehydrogenase subunit 6 n=1 Tax=Linepithema humile TaxID=83485 RepID=A0A191TFT5_LINHU|nr:NADH dehydrogenase subunit 6 [Linepithema humile]ANI87491.1 NADH dehydrogenase subunit 6 [Linepithema humile]QNV47341.1 NADH dehydrogenase subunit 6 [Linepithema humile]